MAKNSKSLAAVQKKIRLKKQNLAEAKKITAEFGLSMAAACVLSARGYKADSTLANYLEPALKTGLPAPEKLLNLDKACELIAQNIKAQNSIAICCDFDVDGLSGGAQMQHFLKTIGVKSKVFVPDRFVDGYGLNEKMVRQIAEEKYALLISIDYGTTNVKELEIARSLGLKSVVIDHHHVGDHKPACDVFINPMQKGCGFAGGVLCASGLAWYVILGLRNHLADYSAKVKAVDPRTYLDLACLGTICDMVPLTGVNRVIARRGLELLSCTKRTGLLALKSAMGLYADVGCHDVSFGIGPRLNAAGRMVNGEMVIDLLTTDDAVLANRVARTLHELNQERQAAEHEVKALALEQLDRRYAIDGDGQLPHGLVVCDEGFHTGVIGIVAQRLVETFYRPAVVLGVDSEGIYKGSARGIKGFSVVEAFSAVAEHLIKFGGHEGAGGCSIASDKLQDFMQAFEEECRNRLSGVDLNPYAEADTEVELSDITVQLVDELKRFAPFGMANPSPVFLTKNLKVNDLRELKSMHLKATLSAGKHNIAGMLWRQVAHPALIKGKNVHIAYKPDYNNFNGLTELQAVLQAVERAA